MAQFTEVMRQAKRMCETQKNCTQCALCRPQGGGECLLDCLLCVDLDEVEQIIKTWAKEHPDNDSNVAHSMKTTTVNQAAQTKGITRQFIA